MSCGLHSPGIPDNCFSCKLDYMRTHTVAIGVPKLFDTSGPTVREQVKEMHEDAARTGAVLEKAR